MSSRKPTAKAILNTPDISAQEAYDKLLRYGYITKCPTDVTASSIGALQAFVNCQYERYEFCKKAARSYSSPFGEGLLRNEWIEETCARFCRNIKYPSTTHLRQQTRTSQHFRPNS